MHSLYELFGRSARIRVMSFFLACSTDDYTIKEIAGILELSRQTVAKEIKSLLRYQIIKPSRIIGHSTLYQLNDKSKYVATLRECEAIKPIESEEVI